MQAHKENSREPIGILHQVTDEHIFAARFVKQYLESANQQQFKSYFS